MQKYILFAQPIITKDCSQQYGMQNNKKKYRKAYINQNIFLNLGKPTEIPNYFHIASFLFYTYKRILYGILTLEFMQSSIMIIIKHKDINFG